MAAVFLMQPWGQSVASIVSLIVLVTMGRTRKLNTATKHDNAAVTADMMWRLIVGIGAVPTLVAFMLRATIPESFRYMLGASNIKQITHSMNRFYAGKRVLPFQEEDQRSIETAPYPGESQIRARLEDDELFRSDAVIDEEGEIEISELRNSGMLWSQISSSPENRTLVIPAFSPQELRNHFISNGNWRQLASISLCGFFLNIAISLLGTSDLRVLNKVWTFSRAQNATSTLAKSETNDSGAELYDALFNGATRSLAIVSAAAVIGSLIVIKFVNRFRRRYVFVLLSIVFALILILTGVFVITGVADSVIIIPLYIACNLVFNLGKFPPQYTWVLKHS